MSQKESYAGREWERGGGEMIEKRGEVEKKQKKNKRN